MDPWNLDMMMETFTHVQDGFPWKLVRIYIKQDRFPWKQDGSMERRWISIGIR